MDERNNLDNSSLNNPREDHDRGSNAERPSSADPRVAQVRQRRLFLAKGPSYVRQKLNGRLFLIPSCITVVGMFCGFLAIMVAIKGNFDYAAKCIMLAIVLDGLDGRVARSLNATSAFGREFDSLSDLIAFGVAPAVMMYSWAFSTSADEFGVLVGFVFVVCSATRLARFNVMTTEDNKTSGFVGLPTPGAAAAIASVSYLIPQPVESQIGAGVVAAYMFLVSFFMVSTFPFFSVKKIKLHRENQWGLVLLLAILVPFAWKYSRVVFFIGSTAYAMSGPVLFLLRRSKKQEKKEAQASSAVS